MLNKREAQGISLNIIVIAVIALIVLVVVIAIFTKETSKTVGTLENCAARGGDCKSSRDACEGTVLTSAKCGGFCFPSPCTMVCCVGIQ